MRSRRSRSRATCSTCSATSRWSATIWCSAAHRRADAEDRPDDDRRDAEGRRGHLAALTLEYAARVGRCRRRRGRRRRARAPGTRLGAASLDVAREQVFVFFFFAVFLFLLYQLYRVFSGFLGPIVWAAILAMRLLPALSPRPAAPCAAGTPLSRRAALTVVVTVGIAVPSASLSSVVTQESVGLYQQLTRVRAVGRAQPDASSRCARRASAAWSSGSGVRGGRSTWSAAERAARAPTSRSARR